MKSLCIIITGLSTGGAEFMLLKLLQNLNRNRFQLRVISLTSRGEIGARIEALGIKVHALGMQSGALHPFKFIQLVRLLRYSKPDVVHTWMYHADLLGGLAAKLAGIKIIVWGIRQGNLDPEQNKRSTLWIMRICSIISSLLPERILTCSERAKVIHVAVGYREDKMVLIPNGFDLERFCPNPAARGAVREELGLAPDTPLVGLIARADPQKNHRGFLEAAARVLAALPQVHFVFAGTGVDANNRVLMASIDRLGLRGHCHLLGRRDDVPRLMAALDLLASSSLGEAFPNVLGEAMACGVPCVVTDVGDSAEIVGETGRVVTPGDMAGLAAHLVELLHWPAGRRAQLGERARERVRARYAISDVARRYEAFYEQLLSER